MKQTLHFTERLEERLSYVKDMSMDTTIEDREKLYSNIMKLKVMEFDSSFSFAVRLVDFNVNPKSKHYYVTYGGRAYYRFIDPYGVDTTGDEIWAIIRGGKLVTIMFRKSIQPLKKLRVDNIIKL